MLSRLAAFTQIAQRTIIFEGADPVSAEASPRSPIVCWKNSKLFASAKLIYAMLLKYAWQNDYCFPGQERLAKEMGAGKRTLYGSWPRVRQPVTQFVTNDHIIRGGPRWCGWASFGKLRAGSLDKALGGLCACSSECLCRFGGRIGRFCWMFRVVFGDGFTANRRLTFNPAVRPAKCPEVV